MKTIIRIYFIAVLVKKEILDTSRTQKSLNLYIYKLNDIYVSACVCMNVCEKVKVSMYLGVETFRFVSHRGSHVF
jgi:hypothetical protein